VKQRSIRCRWIAALLLSLLVGMITVSAALAHPAGVDPAVVGDGTPVPDGTPTPGVTPTPVSTPQQPSILRVLFSAPTLSDALKKILSESVSEEIGSFEQEVAKFTLEFGKILQAPDGNEYGNVAKESLPVAAALAPALFQLRLALYHWGRLTGVDDRALRVVGDWITAGALAVAAGPFLDLIVRLGWWAFGMVMGEQAQMAADYLKSLSVGDIVSGAAQITLLGPLISFGIAIGGIVALVGLFMAFAAAQAVLFILAVISAPIAIISVVPQMGWLRGLWLKAAVIVALLPLAAGGIFKATTAVSLFFVGGGLISGLIRVMWLWGTAGLMLSLAGVLGRFTIAAGADAAKQAIGAVGKITGAAALAATGVGAPAAGVVVGGTGAGAGAAGAGAAGGVGGTLSSGSAALGHYGSPGYQYQAAMSDTWRAGIANMLGVRPAAAFFQTRAAMHDIAARQASLQDRVQRFGTPAPTALARGGQDGQSAPPALDFGYSPSVNDRLSRNFSGTPEAFQDGFAQFSRHFPADIQPQTFVEQHPDEAAIMTQVYMSNKDNIDNSPSPLQAVIDLSGMGGSILG
jgi:hypothetical protein